MATGQRLGDILIEQNLVSKEVIDQALQSQVGGNQRLGNILVRMKVITADQLVETLAKQLDLPICDVFTSFSGEVKRLIPRYLCRKYGVIPLRIKKYNTLELAMANPADTEARTDLEHYTGKVIEPRLARLSDIEKAIPRFITFNIREFFSPAVTNWTGRLALATSLVLVVALGGFIYDYVDKINHGTITKTDTATIYKNHDLMVGFDKNGQINLMGRGAFAAGYYAVTFTSDAVLQSFLTGKQKELSEKQRAWLDWVLVQYREDMPRQAKLVSNN